MVVAMATPWWYDPAEGAYPDGSLDPLDLSSAIRRGPVAEEPPGAYAVFELTAENPYVGVTVFFGSADPSAAVLRAAQAELDTLQIPPVCPSLPDVEPLSISASSGIVGDAVALTCASGSGSKTEATTRRQTGTRLPGGMRIRQRGRDSRVSPRTFPSL